MNNGGEIKMNINSIPCNSQMPCYTYKRSTEYWTKTGTDTAENRRLQSEEYLLIRWYS